MRVKMKAVHRELMIFHEYDLPEARALALIRHGYADQVKSTAPLREEKAKAEKAVTGPTETATASPQRDEWTNKVSPADYLKRYPDGPKADLARSILGSSDE